MTGPSGNKLSICPLRFRITSTKISFDLGCALETLGDPESLGANRSAYYLRDQSLFIYYILTIIFFRSTNQIKIKTVK